MRLRLGTRRSKLAISQSVYVKELLEERWKGLIIDLVKIVTKGDKMLRFSLSEIGGKGVFVKEIEKALLDGSIDLAVHSMKDVPSQLENGLWIPVVPSREDPRDAFVGEHVRRLEDLPEGARVGTSSLRRASQIKMKRPDIEVVPIRGNLDTRIRKMKEMGLSGIVAAKAGLNRLGLSHLASFVFEPEDMVPAVGQGALAVEIRRDDLETLRLIEPIGDGITSLEISEERAFQERMGGSCHIPLGGLCIIRDGSKVFYGFLGDESGKRTFKRKAEFDLDDEAGLSVAEDILSSGGSEVLKELSYVQG